MIISFAWTTTALLDGRKTVTRREWSDGHAAKFKPCDLVDAWDKSPRFKGKKVAVIRIVSIHRLQLGLMLRNRMYGADELKREGGRWNTIEEFCALFTIDNPYRVEFEIVSVEGQSHFCSDCGKQVAHIVPFQRGWVGLCKCMQDTLALDEGKP